jgi:signal transduction histidine kinase
MLAPALFRTTPFRLTVVLLALFSTAAAALLIYIYISTVHEVTKFADRDIAVEMKILENAYDHGGTEGLKAVMAERIATGRPFAYQLLDRNGRRLWGATTLAPIDDLPAETSVWVHFQPPQGLQAAHRRIGRGQRRRLAGGKVLIVAADLTDVAKFVLRIQQALGGAGALVVLLGLIGGLVVSRNVNRQASRLNAVISAVQSGDLRARVKLEGARDEFEDLSAGLNDMLDRLERSIEGLRHAGDAIAHDLRSPLTRLRGRLEVALLDLESGGGDPQAALARAMEDADGVLRTFSAVLAIARLQSGGGAPDPRTFDPADLAGDIAELYAPLCEEQGLSFRRTFTPGLYVRGNREFIAQALANSLDNAVKYTPSGGVVTLGVERTAANEIAFSVTDTGPGVPAADRARVIERFVRLETSRNQPGAGLGLSLVAAVAEAHGGRVELHEGGPPVMGCGRGLRVLLVLPRAA